MDLKEAIRKYFGYLEHERNVSPHTLKNYLSDLEQFVAYLMPPGGEGTRAASAGSAFAKNSGAARYRPSADPGISGASSQHRDAEKFRGAQADLDSRADEILPP